MQQRSKAAVPEAYVQGGTDFWIRLRARLMGNAIRRRLRNSRPLVVLDIGCGFQATNLVENADLISEGWGIDFAISPACKLPNLRFIEAPVEETMESLPGGHFDAILLISVLEHLRNPLNALAHCHRMLTDGGRLIVNVPTWNAKPVLEFLAFRCNRSTSSINDHKMYYSKRDLWPKLIEAGFMPSSVRLSYRFLGMVLMADATK